MAQRPLDGAARRVEVRRTRKIIRLDAGCGERGGEETGAMWDSLEHAYHSRIVEPGREALFLLLVGLIAAFLLIRFSTRMIRRGTPGGRAT